MLSMDILRGQSAERRGQKLRGRSSALRALPSALSLKSLLLRRFRLLLLNRAQDAELLEQLVSVDDHVSIREPRDLADLLLLKRFDELQTHVGVTRAAVERRPLFQIGRAHV